MEASAMTARQRWLIGVRMEKTIFWSVRTVAAMWLAYHSYLLDHARGLDHPKEQSREASRGNIWHLIWFGVARPWENRWLNMRRRSVKHQNRRYDGIFGLQQLQWACGRAMKCPNTSSIEPRKKWYRFIFTMALPWYFTFSCHLITHFIFARWGWDTRQE